MDLSEALILLTSITSTVTMILVAVAVVPHVKQSLLVIRDAILWGTFVLVVTLGMWLGWQRLSARLSGRPSSRVDRTEAAETRTTTVTRAHPAPHVDHVYYGSMSDLR